MRETGTQKAGVLILYPVPCFLSPESVLGVAEVVSMDLRLNRSITRCLNLHSVLCTLNSIPWL